MRFGPAMAWNCRLRTAGASVLLFGVLALNALASGTTNRPPAPDKDGRWLPRASRALSIAQAGDKVFLSWKSEPGKLYTIMYTDQQSEKAVWQPLPGYERMPGTGRQEQVEFPFDPTRPRRYLMRIEDAAPGR